MRQRYPTVPFYSHPSAPPEFRQRKPMTVEDDSISTKNLVNDIDELLEGLIHDGANGRLQGKVLREVLDIYDEVLEIIDEYISSWNEDASCTNAGDNMPQLVPAAQKTRVQQDAEKIIENLLDDYADYFATQEQELGQHDCHGDKHSDIVEPICYLDCKLSNVKSNEW
ncbi:MAG: hypothetical protein LQ351_000978 [Letrouitia transgressa]|nr:MAG: hypothetical protein LQ351_000978 [Letrouitia transgressa]